MTEVHLEVGEQKVREFTRKKPLAAVVELVWNSLDANATFVSITLERSPFGAIERVVVSDNGDGFTPTQARESFQQYGDTWKARRRHTHGNSPRILHGSKGEGRLFAFALGDDLSWESVAAVDGQGYKTKVSVSERQPTVWRIGEPIDTSAPTGTTVTAKVPQGRALRALEDAANQLTARLAFYLKSYSDVTVVYDGITLDPDSIIEQIVDLPLDPPYAAASDDGMSAPFVSFVEWKTRMSDRKMLVCDAAGTALVEYGDDYNDPVIPFTPYLRSDLFRNATVESLHVLAMEHSDLLQAATASIGKHLAKRRREVSGQIVNQLKSEGIYPYEGEAADAAELVERQTFDLVVTTARGALPAKGQPRHLAVRLLQSALESSPGHLQTILGSVLALPEAEREQLALLLGRTELSNIISAANVVTDRLDFIGSLRKLLASPETRRDLREVDQLHPMVAANLWLFGEEWNLARTEVGLTAVLRAHLESFGEDVALETDLRSVTREDGRSGRVDILLFRGAGDERRRERLIVELKRPTKKVGPKELAQVKSYARALVEDPQFHGAECRWKFVLLTYEVDSKIERDIRQKDKPPGLADDQDEYQVWVQSWGEVLDGAERKLSFFREQLQYEATEDRVSQYLREQHADVLPATASEAKSA